MRWLIGWGMRNRRPVVGFAVVLLLLGIWQFPKMKTDVLPEFAPTTVEVQTEALGLSAEEVEQLITVPMEQDLLNGVAYMTSIRSKSVPGLSSIEMIFDPGTPVLRARQVVAERLVGAAALPNVSKPPQMLQPVASTSRVMMVGISSDTLTPIQLGVLARWTLRPNLLGVDGVSNVAIFGQRERQLQVQVDPKVLADKGVGLDQIIETTGNALWVSPLTYIEASTPGAGGFIETPNQRLTVQHESPIVSPEQLAAVALQGDGKLTGLTLGDVAKVVEDHQPLIGDAVFGDQPGLLLVVEKYPGQSTAVVAERVGDALELLEPGLTGVSLDTEIYQPAAYVQNASSALRIAIAIGLILAAIVLFLLVLELRTALIAGIAMVVSGAVAGLVLYVRQTTINSMVVAGMVLALAFIVDDAIGVTAAVTRRMRAGRINGDDSSTNTSLIREGAMDHSSPALYALAITIVTAVPLLLVDGLLSESFLPPIATTYILAIVASALVAAVLVPALSIMILGDSAVAPAESRVAQKIATTYSRLATGKLASGSTALIGCVVLLALGVAGFSQFNSDTVPRFRETDLLVKVTGEPGRSLPATTDTIARMNTQLGAIDGVARVGGHIGRALTSDQVINVNEGEVWLRLNEDADYDEAISNIKTTLGGFTEVKTELTTYTGARLETVLQPGLAPIDVRIFGENRELLIAKADEVKAAIASIDGVKNPRVEIAPTEPSLQVKVDLAKAQAAGVLPGDIRRAAATLLQGIEVGNLFEDTKVFEVIVTGTPELRSSVETVEGLLIQTPSGTPSRLGDLASVTVGETPTVIERDASARVIDIVADVDGRTSAEVSADVSKVLSGLSFDLGYHAELVGDYQDHRDATRRVMIVALVAAVIALLVLQAAGGSWKLSVMMWITLPAAAIGAILVILIDGGDVTIGHVVGLVGTIGLAVRNVSSIVRRSNQLELASTFENRADVVAQAAGERASSMIISTVVSIVALTPMALLGGSAGGEIVSPMAWTLIGGLVSSAVVGLWIVPALYRKYAPDVRASQLFVDAQPTEMAHAGVTHA